MFEVYMWMLTSIFIGCVEAESTSSVVENTVDLNDRNMSNNHFEQQGLQSDVFEAAMYAYQKAKSDGVTDNPVYTVIDLRLHSKEKRLWTLNVETGELLFHEVTTHGRLSDINHDGFLDSVSNVPQSKKTSVGLYKTAEVYTGSHGLSLRLDGLEKGFNDNARMRDIVIHGADYAGHEFIEKYGKAGRSLGCPAVSKDVSDDLISTIKEGALLFVYVPDDTWVSESKYLP